jgi:prophage tail gpP-like protein
MRLEVNGVQYSNFTESSCSLRLDALSSAFSFKAVTGAEPLPFKGGEACQVFVSDELVLTGFIEVVNVSYDGTRHNVTISGRDKTGDLLDSSIGDMGDINGDGLTLKKLIELVIEHLGLDLKVVDEVNPAEFNAAEDIAAPEPGDFAFNFIERYAKKRQVLLTSNAQGNVVIASNSGIEADGKIQHMINADDNNVLSSNYSYDTTGRFNAYKVISGQNPSALNKGGAFSSKSVVDQSASATDTEIRKGRQLVIVPDVSMSSENCQKRADWDADIRRFRGLIYGASVPLFRVGGKAGSLWRLNRLYQIVDEFIGKVERMLCNTITFSQSVDDGSTTELGFVGKNAYTLFIGPPKVGKETSIF